MPRAVATLTRTVHPYALLSLVIGAQGAILVFVHGFGNPGWDAVCGSILAGLAVLATVGHAWLSGLTLDVPQAVFDVLGKFNGALVTLLAGSGMIVQYVGSTAPQLTPLLSLVLQGLALLASLFAQTLKVQAVRTASRAAAIAVVPRNTAAGGTG